MKLVSAALIVLLSIFLIKITFIDTKLGVESNINQGVSSHNNAKANTVSGEQIELALNELPDSSKSLVQKIIFINHNKFSKGCLKYITPSEGSLDQDLDNLLKHELINRVQAEGGSSELFEMPDDIQRLLLSSLGKDKRTEILMSVVESLNNSMPLRKNEQYFEQYLSILQNHDIIPNFEKLIVEAEAFNLGLKEVLELRKNLINLYLLSHDGDGCSRLADWFYSNENIINNLISQGHEEEALIAEYMRAIGVYETVINANFAKSIEIVSKAKKYIDGLIDSLQNMGGYTPVKEDYIQLRRDINNQLAQAYLEVADIEKAESVLLENIEQKNGLYWHNKARVYASKGDYKNAIFCTDQALEIRKNLPKNSALVMPLYLRRIQYLNYIDEYETVYNIAIALYDAEKITPESTTLNAAHILGELSRAELGLRNKEGALAHATQAKHIYMNMQSRHNAQLHLSTDRYLAYSFVSEGKALFEFARYQEALDNYLQAEIIFNNVYGQNVKNMDEVSYLYLHAAKTASKLKDQELLKQFKDKQLQQFGEDHPRTTEIMKL